MIGDTLTLSVFFLPPLSLLPLLLFTTVLLTLLIDVDHLIEDAQSGRLVPLERIASDD